MRWRARGRRGPGARGFTLLEVLVALAVVGIALAAVIKATGSFTGNAAALRNQTVAHWVALNHMAELQLQVDWPSKGTERGSARMAGREWHWTTRVEDSPDENLRRVEVDVRVDEDDDNPTASVIGFVERPL